MKQIMISLLSLTAILFLWRIMGFGFYAKLAFLAYVAYLIVRYLLGTIAGSDDADQH